MTIPVAATNAIHTHCKMYRPSYDQEPTLGLGLHFSKGLLCSYRRVVISRAVSANLLGVLVWHSFAYLRAHTLVDV